MDFIWRDRKSRAELYQGGKTDVEDQDSLRECDIKLIVLASCDFQPPTDDIPDRFSIVRVRLIDDHKLDQETIVWTRDAAKGAARVVKTFMEKGYNVLSSCYMGWNRSGLVTAMAAIDMGIPAHIIIRRIRSARSPGGLSNTLFVQMIEEEWRRLSRT